LTGFLAEYFGRKNYYIASMIIFTIASYLCGQSNSLVELIIWRFVQGVGGGALLSTSQAILRFRRGGFIRLESDEEDEPREFRRKMAYY
jgi:MFS family permease